MSEILLRAPRAEDYETVVRRQGALYRDEYGWDESFEALVRTIVEEYRANFNPERERAWFAELDGQHAGHIFVVQHPEQPQMAKLRLLMVEKSARGHGLGRRLVQECIAFARSVGYTRMMLWTQSNLHAAIRIYEASGFALVKEEKHHSFGHDLVGQIWERDL